MDDTDDDFMFEDDFINFENSMELLENQIRGRVELRNVDGSLCKVNREEYSRGPKRHKGDSNPWLTVKWLVEITDRNTNNPRHRRGKEFRRRFRVPLPVFNLIVFKCRQTGEALFNYPERSITGSFNCSTFL